MAENENVEKVGETKKVKREGKVKAKIESHWDKHKKKYIIGGVLVAGVTIGVLGHKLYIRGKLEELANDVKELNTNVKDLIAINSSANSTGDISAAENASIDISMGNNITTIIQQLDRPGHAGDIVQCIEDPSIIYTSKVKAAKAIGISEKTLRKRLVDKIPIDGKTYEHIGSFNADEQPTAS